MMRILLNEKNIELTVLKTVEYLKNNKIVIIPTDTVYGISCILESKKGIEKIYNIKKRDKSKPFLNLVGDLSVLGKFFDIKNDQMEYLKNNYPKKPTTFLLSLKNEQKIGIRMPSKAIKDLKGIFIHKVLKTLKKPIISTSLNLSNEKQINNPCKNGNLLKFQNHIDLFVDMGNINNKSSYIQDITDLNNIKKIR